MMKSTNYILADGRWRGNHGIGRFAKEILARLQNTNVLDRGPHPLSPSNLLWQSWQLSCKTNYKVYFTPGFNPVVHSRIPYVMTIHDLIHLQFPGETNKLFKQLYYQTFIKQSAKKACKILTVSEFSRQTILDWVNVPPDKVEVVGNGISSHFNADGAKYQPGFSYLLHVGNMKEHKNTSRLIHAFAKAKIDTHVHLICTSRFNRDVLSIISKHKLEKRIHSHPNLDDQQIAEYYRGALGIVFPSLYEGFGLPIIEGMASGIPVLTSTVTSLPEVAGNAAKLINPYEIDDIALGIEQLVSDTRLRNHLIDKGLQRAKQFSWDATATKIQQILDDIN